MSELQAGYICPLCDKEILLPDEDNPNTMLICHECNNYFQYYTSDSSCLSGFCVCRINELAKQKIRPTSLPFFSGAKAYNRMSSF